MISCTSPPEQKLPPCAGQHDGADLARGGQTLERVDELGIRVEGQRVLALGAVQRDGRHAALERPAEMSRADLGHEDAAFF